MQTVFLRTGVAAVAIIMSGFAGSVAAQEAPEGSQETSESGDIIVTARRVEERLQDVPISITVFSQQQIRDRNIITATDLGTYTPSLSVNQRFGPEKSSFAIRGFTQEPNTAPSVGVYFADVTAPRAQGGTTSGNTAVTGSFMDLQNVQVLKGPQGTLFGRNTTGGAVILVPNKPTSDLEGWLEGSVGDYGMRRLQGVANIPLADTFKVRFAADRNKREGYMKNQSGIGPDAYNDVNYFAARLSILVDLTPSLENYTIATYSNSFGRGYGARIVACETDPARRTGGIVFTAQPACDQIARQNARGDGPLDVEIDNADPFVKLRHWQVINTTTWQASDNLRVKNIVSYAEFRERTSLSLNGDNFFVAAPFPSAGEKFQYIVLDPQPGYDNASQSTFTEELQFQGEAADGWFNWQLGGYLEVSNPLGFSSSNTGILLNCTDVENLACTNPLGIGSVSVSSQQFRFNNKGLYAQTTFNLTDQLSITGGFRYTWDKIRAFGDVTRLRLLPTGTYVRACNNTVRFGTGAVTDPLQCRVNFSQSSSRPTWLIDIDFKPVDDVLLYAKYARGYRQGGINPNAPGLETWDPEKVDAYEMGAKLSFAGGMRGYFNIAGFYNDFSDQQIIANAISAVAGFAGTQAVINAGKSTIKGIEVDASATLFGNLRFDLGYTYLDTKLKELNLPVLPTPPYQPTPVPTARVGDQLALSPKNRLTISATYTLPLDESIGEVSFGATFVHTDKQIVSLATLPQYQYLPATDLLNLNVNWNSAFGRPIDLSAFVTNVTNQIYPVSVGSAYLSAGFETLLYGAPRMWGVRARFRFGK